MSRLEKAGEQAVKILQMGVGKFPHACRITPGGQEKQLRQNRSLNVSIISFLEK